MPIADWLKRRLLERAIDREAKARGINLKPYRAQARHVLRKTENIMLPKAGWKTSEFWLTLGSVVLAVVDSQLGLELPKEGLLAVAAYILSRGWAKSKQGPTDTTEQPTE